MKLLPLNPICPIIKTILVFCFITCQINAQIIDFEKDLKIAPFLSILLGQDPAPSLLLTNRSQESYIDYYGNSSFKIRANPAILSSRASLIFSSDGRVGIGNTEADVAFTIRPQASNDFTTSLQVQKSTGFNSFAINDFETISNIPMRIQGEYGTVSSARRQLFIAQPENSAWGWYLGNQSGTFTTSDNDLYFTVQRNNILSLAAFVQDDADNVRMNFTGQHRSLVKEINYNLIKDDPDALTGLIVVADQNEYMSMAGGLKVGQKAITIDESLPIVSLSHSSKSKNVFGVISGIEAEERRDEYGAWVTPYDKEEGDQRVYINSVGEGGIWVIDSGGNLESGDYIVTSEVRGYGMLQKSEFLANYTVAKITMDCDFNPPLIPERRIKKEIKVIGEQEETVNVLDEFGRLQWEPICDENGAPLMESAYKIRYLLQNGTLLTKAEYDSLKAIGERVYKAAFVGCTYHCG